MSFFTGSLQDIPQSVWCVLHCKKPSQCPSRHPSWQTGPVLLLWSESLLQTPWDTETIQWQSRKRSAPLSFYADKSRRKVDSPLALVWIRKQSMGGDTGGCGLVIWVHRTLKTEDVMLMWHNLNQDCRGQSVFSDSFSFQHITFNYFYTMMSPWISWM